MTPASKSAAPRLAWDTGTAYDFLASLNVLHEPEKFGLRGAWAAGVRSRLTPEEREFFEEMLGIVELPYRFVYHLPPPKDAATLLYHLKQMPAAERIYGVTARPGQPKDPIRARLREVTQRGGWNEDDRQFVLAQYAARAEQQEQEEHPMTPRRLERILDACARAGEVGERLLDALQSYYTVFFEEEEKRIAPKLEEALTRGREQAGRLSVAELIEELSRGVTFAELDWAEEIILAPSYWLSPLISGDDLDSKRMLLLYGARPPGESLVPGEIVPDDLLAALKALADPSRLRILRFLMQEHLTPAELSRRLRLRAPTVTHHLHALRLAGLVRFVIKGKNERLYSARMEAVQGVYTLLKDFLEQDVVEAEPLETFERGRMF
ncbi:MAG: winged helix-turn-helix transcriptional regulator [Chloroflexi bacterium]|nr:winged helix-turn-helix transcriptional regulator [Chloroflexota bacterium]